MEGICDVSDAFITIENLEKAHIKNFGQKHTVC
jgi:hypothetical protein